MQSNTFEQLSNRQVANARATTPGRIIADGGEQPASPTVTSPRTPTVDETIVALCELASDAPRADGKPVWHNVVDGVVRFLSAFTPPMHHEIIRRLQAGLDRNTQANTAKTAAESKTLTEDADEVDEDGERESVIDAMANSLEDQCNDRLKPAPGDPERGTRTLWTLLIVQGETNTPDKCLMQRLFLASDENILECANATHQAFLDLGGVDLTGVLAGDPDTWQIKTSR